MSAEATDVKYVQITIRLGGTQNVRIEADSRVTYDQSEHNLEYQRTGYSGKGDIDQLVGEVLTNLKNALGNEESINLCVDGEKIVACSE